MNDRNVPITRFVSLESCAISDEIVPIKEHFLIFNEVNFVKEYICVGIVDPNSWSSIKKLVRLFMVKISTPMLVTPVFPGNSGSWS